jgi:pimeloyl-ACP methyl ester carboxylesterase
VLVLVPDGFIPFDAIGDEPHFAAFVDRLSSFGRLICFDRRGMGLSDPLTPGAPPTLEQWMRDLLAVMDAAGAERATLIGLAEGGFVSTLTAATHPERVDALVLVNATPGVSVIAEGGHAARFVRGSDLTTELTGETAFLGVAEFAPSAADDER